VDPADDDEIAPDSELDVPPGCAVEVAHVPGSVWKVVVRVGDRVAAGDPLVVLESMKMEIPVVASDGGVVHEIVTAEGRSIAAGDPVCVLRVS
jgi:urea carboxylase